MSVRPYRDIYRRTSRLIHVGGVPVGGDAPIAVQSMTNTPTTDVQARWRRSADWKRRARISSGFPARMKTRRRR